jgi:hypothetical protein
MSLGTMNASETGLDFCPHSSRLTRHDRHNTEKWVESQYLALFNKPHAFNFKTVIFKTNVLRNTPINASNFGKVLSR